MMMNEMMEWTERRRREMEINRDWRKSRSHVGDAEVLVGGCRWMLYFGLIHMLPLSSLCNMYVYACCY